MSRVFTLDIFCFSDIIIQMVKVTGDIYLLGDVHGAFAPTFHRIEQAKIKNATILCVGDLGAGYPKYDGVWLNKLAERFASKNIQFLSIRGNHDDPDYYDGRTYGGCLTLLKDYTYLDVNGEKWLAIGGAVSVDRCDNVPGYSYWYHEGFDLKEELIEPVDVLVTHTGPNWIGPNGLNGIVKYYTEKEGLGLWLELQEERKKMDRLYELAKAKKAYLGHFHVHDLKDKDGCRARILKCDELVLYNP